LEGSISSEQHPNRLTVIFATAQLFLYANTIKTRIPTPEGTSVIMSAISRVERELLLLLLLLLVVVVVVVVDEQSPSTLLDAEPLVAPVEAFKVRDVEYVVK
jgi:hypothetical protein